MGISEILSKEGWTVKQSLDGRFYGFNSQTLNMTETCDNLDLVKAAIIQTRLNQIDIDPNRVYLIDVNLIEDNPWQTRIKLDSNHIKELATDIQRRGLNDYMGHYCPAFIPPKMTEKKND